MRLRDALTLTLSQGERELCAFHFGFSLVIEENKDMEKALHIRTTVLPGGKIEIVSQELTEGESVDVVVSSASPTKRRSAVDILNEAPGGLAFKTAADVAAYLKEEKESWGS